MFWAFCCAKMVIMKTCTMCNQEKPIEAFQIDNRLKSGRRGRCKACAYQASKASRTKHDNAWKQQLLWKFKITPEDYLAMLERQGGVCAICKRPPGKRRLAVDHDHSCCPGVPTCGACVRGLLCSGCNTKIEWTELHYTTLQSYLNS